MCKLRYGQQGLKVSLCRCEIVHAPSNPTEFQSTEAKGEHFELLDGGVWPACCNPGYSLSAVSCMYVIFSWRANSVRNT